MAISVTQLRVSFVWSATAAALFDAPAAAAGYWVGDAARYQSAFLDLQAGKVGAVNGVELPWQPGKRQRFWSFYGTTDNVQQLTANRAWKLLVPFRARGPVAGLQPPAGVTLVQEAFWFPHAVGFVLGMTLDLSGSIDAAVDRAAALRHERAFTVTGGTAALTAAEAASQALQKLLTDAAGAAAAVLEPQEPLTVVSILNADGPELLQAVQDGGPLHRALEGLATLSTTWKVNALQPLAAGSIPQGKTRPALHVLYGAKLGRTVWHPHYFNLQGAKRAPLNCYHRNLVFASLQTQSLLRLVGLVADRRAQGVVPTGRLNDCALRACGILGRMYGGESSSYRSHTIRRQLADSDRLAAVGAERVARGMMPLI